MQADPWQAPPVEGAKALAAAPLADGPQGLGLWQARGSSFDLQPAVPQAEGLPVPRPLVPTGLEGHHAAAADWAGSGLEVRGLHGWGASLQAAAAPMAAREQCIAAPTLALAALPCPSLPRYAHSVLTHSHALRPLLCPRSMAGQPTSSGWGSGSCSTDEEDGCDGATSPYCYYYGSTALSAGRPAPLPSPWCGTTLASPRQLQPPGTPSPRTAAAPAAPAPAGGPPATGAEAHVLLEQHGMQVGGVRSAASCLITSGCAVPAPTCGSLPSCCSGCPVLMLAAPQLT